MEYLFLLEFGVQICVWAIVEFGVAAGLTAATARHRAKRDRPFTTVQIFGSIALTGLLVGLFSAWPLPGHLFEDRGARFATFLVSPVVTGGAMHYFGRWWWRTSEAPPALWTFPGGAGFALAISLARFVILG